jgi:hypothetical protein
MKIGRLHIGKMPTNEAHRFVLASWAHRSGYWRWVLSWAPPTQGMAFRFGPAMDSGKRYWVGFKGCRHFAVWATVPRVGGFSFSTQPRLTPNDELSRRRPAAIGLNRMRPRRSA